MAFEITGSIPLFQVYDMPVAIRFYVETLGFEIVNTSPEIDAPEGRYFQWAWLRLGGAELMLNTAYDAGERPPARDAARWNGHADTCLYLTCPDLDAVQADLASAGLDVTPPVAAPYGFRQLHLRDPDGYALCFQTPA